VTAALRALPRPLQVMVAATIAVGMVSQLLMLLGSPGDAARPSVIWPLLGAGLVALQLRHSFAAARGQRPRGGWWTLLAMAVLVYAPLPWLTWNWMATQVLLMASAPMVARSRALAVALAAAPAVGTVLYFPAFYHPDDPNVSALRFTLSEMGFWAISLLMGAAVVYGAALMARGASELQAAHTELAELTIVQERLRISRDLHDLIGQSLSAVSLRGDLALRLLPTDPQAAQSEIANLTEAARAGLHGILTVTSDPPTADLGAEADGAKALLAAAGIDATVEVDPAVVTPGARTVFAWALREGVTNVLRHSEATACSITVTRTAHRAARLEIVNDGVRQPASAGGTVPGNGLPGLAERAKALGGELTAGPLPAQRYRLRIEVPGEVS
jgi:two-component system sensor histidine kinase DesK